MPKFIKIRSAYINVDHIVAIEADWAGDIYISLTNGHPIKYRGTPKQLAELIRDAKPLHEVVLEVANEQSK